MRYFVDKFSVNEIASIFDSARQIYRDAKTGEVDDVPFLNNIEFEIKIQNLMEEKHIKIPTSKEEFDLLFEKAKPVGWNK
jgi:hypothetical protein